MQLIEQFGRWSKFVGTTETNGDMSQASTESIIGLLEAKDVGLEIAWTGTPAGTIAIAASNTGENWNDLTFSPALTAPAGSAGSAFANITDLMAKAVRVKYTRTSGSGTITVRAAIKREI